MTMIIYDQLLKIKFDSFFNNFSNLFSNNYFCCKLVREEDWRRFIRASWQKLRRDRHGGNKDFSES